VKFVKKILSANDVIDACVCVTVCLCFCSFLWYTV